MSSSNLIRTGGLAALLGGALLAVSELWALFTRASADLSEVATSTSYALQSWMLLLGAVLILGGLVGLYAHQREAAGILGLVGFLVAFIGTALAVGAFWVSVFIVPNLAVEVPALLDSSDPVGFLVSFWLFALGWLLFGIASLRARVYPRIATILLIIGAVITFLPVPGTGVVEGAAIAWLGFALLSGGSVPVEQPARVS